MIHAKNKYLTFLLKHSLQGNHHYDYGATLLRLLKSGGGCLGGVIYAKGRNLKGGGGSDKVCKLSIYLSCPSLSLSLSLMSVSLSFSLYLSLSFTPYLPQIFKLLSFMFCFAKPTFNNSAVDKKNNLNLVFSYFYMVQ